MVLMAAVEDQFVLIAPRADGIEFFKAHADRIDQIVTSGAELVARVFAHPLPVGLRMSLGRGSQIGIHSGRRRGHVLAQELLPDKQSRGPLKSCLRALRKATGITLGPAIPALSDCAGKVTRAKSCAGAGTP